MRLVEDRREAVVALDMMAAARLASVRRLAAFAATHAGARGIDSVRFASPLASEHSRSPDEVLLRLIWQLDAGLPRPFVNCAVGD